MRKSNTNEVILHIAACHLENLAESRDMDGGPEFEFGDIVEAVMGEGPRDWEAYGLSGRSAKRVTRESAKRAVWCLLQRPEWERYALAHPGMEYPVSAIRYATNNEILVRQLQSKLTR